MKSRIVFHDFARGFVRSRRRITAILLVFSLAATFLLSRLFCISVFTYEEYRQKVFDEITTTSTLRAARGNIYDCNMNLLATEKTVWRVFVSPRAIAKRSKEEGIDRAAFISAGLASILDVSSEKLYNRMKDTKVLDVTVRQSVEEDKYREVLSFIRQYGFEDLIFTEGSTSRYYPEGKLAAHVLGFTGSDNQGLYGLEYSYDSVLRGKDGSFLYAKDANGNPLPTEYSSFVPAEDGADVVTTIDSYIQSELEAILETVVQNHKVTDRVTGIVMNTATGAILAMGTSGAFDPNDPYALDPLSAEKLSASNYIQGTEEYNAFRKELLEKMWSNKSVSETYEPGSTFKIVTVSAAIDLGVAKPSDTFSCHGSTEVGGWTIHCHKRTGHGSGFSLAYGLQMSCNPTMIALSGRVGAENFHNYVEKFGYLEKTGIDLPGEASSIFHSAASMGPTELATASFGQRFKVSILSQLTAVAAVANGGKLVTPYVVQTATAKDGKVLFEHQTEVKRQVISEEVANTVAAMLEEGVSGDGGAKNARVEGYKIAAKTGTSQKFDVLDENGNSYLRIGSTVAFAPSDDATRGIAVILVVDEPQSAVKYGSTVAAPYVSQLLGKILPYLGYNSSSESQKAEVGGYVGMNLRAALASLKESGLDAEVIGDGAVVLSQVPERGSSLPLGTKILLYTAEGAPEYVTVPDAVGKSAFEANKLLTDAGLCVAVDGVDGEPALRVTGQSVPPGTVVRRGEVIRITVLVTDFED